MSIVSPEHWVVDEATGCWNWIGTISSNGYGVAHIGRKTTSAHRAVYLVIIGSVARGLELDHLCRNRRCVNPNHLEPVTHSENVKRATRIHSSFCKYGHVLDGIRTREGAGRYCKTCVKLRKQKQRSQGKSN